MNIDNLKIKDDLKETRINCIPARIRQCDGFVIEAVTVQPNRQIIFNLIDELVNHHNFNVYSLRHTETDWSEPKYVSKNHILINRFGWFLTKDTMKFSTKEQDVKLRKTNSIYFDSSDGDMVEHSCIGYCKDVDVLEYLSSK